MKTTTTFIAFLLPFISSVLAAPITRNFTSSQSPPTPVRCATYHTSANGVYCVTISCDGTYTKAKFAPYDDANLTARSDPSSNFIPGSGPSNDLNPASNPVSGSSSGSGSHYSPSPDYSYSPSPSPDYNTNPKPVSDSGSGFGSGSGYIPGDVPGLNPSSNSIPTPISGL